MIKVPKKKEFLRRIKAFERHEARSPIYEISTNLIMKLWNNIKEVTDGLIILLLVWNQAFYRYGYFEFRKLEDWVRKWKRELDTLRKRKIDTFNVKDEKLIKKLFNSLLEVLSVKIKVKKYSPVAVSKTLHLLAPELFPLWDNAISREYGCYWYRSELAYKKYLEFCRKMQYLANQIKNYKLPKNRPILKLIDEYNYAKYTKNW